MHHCRRFYLEVAGVRRFRIAESWEQDGYRMARPRYFCDDAMLPGSPEAAEVAALAAAVEAHADAWVDRVKWVSISWAAHFLALRCSLDVGQLRKMEGSQRSWRAHERCTVTQFTRQ